MDNGLGFGLVMSCLGSQNEHRMVRMSRRSMVSVGIASLVLPGLTVLVGPKCGHAVDNEAYDQYASHYDDLESSTVATGLGLERLRKETISSYASGRILEVAIGTGLNLPFYDFKRVTHVTGVDSSREMLNRARNRSLQMGHASDVQLLSGSADHLDLPSDSFDTVVSTFSLCVLRNAEVAFSEMLRVCRTGGLLLLLEHTRSDIPSLGWYQDLTVDPVASFSKGCRWNLDVVEIARKFPSTEIQREERFLLGTVVVLVVKKL